jgi:serine/threonine protein phosphatase 1
MRKIIIGDVHGCLDELKLLIRKCELKKDDHIFFLGDLINKGPYSIEVLEYIHFISEFYTVDLILGNHEEKFLRFINNKNNNLEAFKQMNLKFDLNAIEKNITPSILNFLRLGYFSYRIQKLGILLIHGGLTKNCKLDLKKNYRYGLQSKEELKELKLLTMTRCIDKNGDFVALGSENEESKFWAQEYDGKHGLVLFGHQVFFQDEPMHFKNAIGLDGGCVFGGYLFAYIIDDCENKWIGVKAMKKYVS